MKTSPTRIAPCIVSASAALRRSVQALLCGLALTLAFAAAHAAGPPEAMTYQGFLVDANGAILAPNTPANYPVIFRIFAAPTGGTSLWTEQQIVTVDKGNFSVILSEGTAVGGEPRGPLSSVLSTNGADRYIQISVTLGATTSDMLPRLRLLPSPYAFLATSANNLVSPSGVPVIKYANNRAEVTGDLYFSGGLFGNGSGLTGLSTDQLGTGTLSDTRLSANVALRNVNNQFSANQTINGTLGLATAGAAFPLTIGNNTLGDKISLWGQSLNSFGFGVQPSLLQIHSDGASSDIAFGYGSSAAMSETMRVKGNGNVGIGTFAPSARLSLVAPGGSEITGNARSTTLLTSAGTLATAPNSELALATFGLNSGNNSSLGLRGLRTSSGSDWTSTAVGLSMDVDNSPHAGASLWLHANGNVGIGTTTPSSKLEVNGNIKATSMTVNGLTVNGPVNAATFNGEKAPVTYVVGPGSNLNSWREQQIDASSLLADDNGGTIRVLLRNHVTKEVRTVSYEFYMENDSNNFGQATRYGSTRSTYGGEWNYRLGSGTTNDRYDLAWFADWIWIRNYRSGAAFGGVDAPAENAANRYKFWILVSPNITATVILYDR